MSREEWIRFVEAGRERWQGLSLRAEELGLPIAVLHNAAHLSAREMRRYTDPQIALMADSLHFGTFWERHKGEPEDGFTHFARIFPGFNTPAIRELLTEGFSHQS